MSSDSSPVSRLRERHTGLHQCDAYWFRPGPSERCPTIAALDALQARIDAATVLIRQAMKGRHFSIQPNTGDSETRCGAPFGTSIDTCPNCQPFRAWLEGDKEEHSE